MQYVKMHGLGNDFIVFYDKDGVNKDYTSLAIKLCHRQTGIGADGLIIAIPSDIADIGMRIINADGSEAEMCGNGARVFAKFVYESGLVVKEEMTVDTLAGIIKPRVYIQDAQVVSVTIDMGEPIFDVTKIPINVAQDKVLHYTLEIEGVSYSVSTVLLGVPHTQVYVESIETIAMHAIGPMIEKHPLFPKGSNVNFVEIVNRQRIKVRTWERGAGATLACGTGSCASVVTSYENGLTERNVVVELYLGELIIEYSSNNHVYMTGDAEQVFVATGI